MNWQLAEAKRRFSQLVQRALDEGPQVVTRRGVAVVVVVSSEEFRRLHGTAVDFKDFLLALPDLHQTDIVRSGDVTRLVEL